MCDNDMFSSDTEFNSDSPEKLDLLMNRMWLWLRCKILVFLPISRGISVKPAELQSTDDVGASQVHCLGHADAV